MSTPLEFESVSAAFRWAREQADPLDALAGVVHANIKRHEFGFATDIVAGLESFMSELDAKKRVMFKRELRVADEALIDGRFYDIHYAEGGGDFVATFIHSEGGQETTLSMNAADAERVAPGVWRCTTGAFEVSLYKLEPLKETPAE